MKQPLPLVALLYTAGLVLARAWVPPVGWLLTATAGAAALTLVWVWREQRGRAGALGGLIFLTGWVNLAARTAILAPHDLRTQARAEPELVSLRGTLAQTPEQRLFVREEQEVWHTLAVVDATALGRDAGWQPVRGTVLVRTPGVLPAELFGGRGVEIRGVLRPPAGPLAEGLFDYRTFLASQGMYFLLQAGGAEDWKTLDVRPAVPPLADRFQIWARRTMAHGLPVEDEELRLLWAMTLGWKAPLTDEVSEPFMRSGTMHIFAISGLHIALIAGILVQVLRLVQVPRAACGWVVIPLIWFYTAATGWQSSAIRSTIMMTVIIAGWTLRRPGHLLNSLAAAGFIILLWQPEQLFQASFQLSFFVVLSIALLLPPFEALRQRLLLPDPLLPVELRPRWRRWLDLPLSWLTTSLATSVAAWLGSLPLIAYYFHLVTPVSLLANLVVVPLSSLALMCNLGSLVCGDWLPLGAELFNHSAWFWMHCMLRVSDWFVALPGAYFYVPAPRWPWFVVFYGTLGAGMSGWWRRPARRPLMAGAAAGLIVIGLGAWAYDRGTVEITILPLNGGHAVYVDATGRREDLLVDCGDENAVNFVMKPFLRARGVNRLPRLLLTHGTWRHVGGAELIAREFAVSEVILNATPFRSTPYRRMLEDWQPTSGPLRQVSRGDDAAGWQVEHPAALDHFAQADDQALVLTREVGGTRLLLLANLGKPGQVALLERHPGLRADIVVTGLPQHGEPVTDAFLDQVQPQLLVVCTAAFPVGARGSPRLHERLARRGIPVLYTDATGAVTLTLRNRDWSWRTMNPPSPAKGAKHLPPASELELGAADE